VRRRVQETGITSQTPQIEGARLATLGGAPRQATLLNAQPSATGVDLAAGSLSGVSEGSTFALFADSTSAVRDGELPLATGTISAVDSFRAMLRLDKLPVKPLPTRLVARELQHSFGTAQMRVRVDALTPASKKAIADALVTSRVAKVAEPAQYVVSTTDTADSYAALLSLDKHKLTRLGAVADPGFGDGVRDALEKLAHVNALLALRTDPAKAGLLFCIDNDQTYDVYACPPGKGPKGRPELIVGQRAKVTVMQNGPTKRFVYVFGIDGSLGIDQVVPEPGTTEPELTAGKPNAYQVEPNSPGRYRFVTIATTEPIQGAALQQDRAGARDLAACPTALDRLLCAAASGTRDAKAARVGVWTAIVTEVDVWEATAP
jgi:hypothetical protein